VTGGSDHRVIDRNHRQRANGQPFGLDLVEFGNLFFERAARERDAENAFLE